MKMTFQEMIATLTHYWAERGCAVHQGYDLEVGAGTFNPATFLRCLGPEPYSAVYVEPSRRPQDGRYGENPNRVQFYHQMQVILKPSPPDMQDLYLKSLESIGLDLSAHDIRFVHDDWENPTIGAFGLGWEVWIDGMEMTQYTYFQTVGGMSLSPVSGELTYGLERLAMYLQDVDSMFDLKWNETLTYGDIFKRNEFEWSHYNFHEANVQMWQRHFEDFEKEALKLISHNYPIPAYDFVMKASHAFNILDARGSISVSERARYIARIRNLSKDLANCYLKSREAQAFPLLKEKKAKVAKVAALPETKSSKEKDDFLLEIGSEELPATFVPIGMRNLKKALTEALAEFDYEEIKVYGTPRRLSVLVKGLARESKTIFKEKKGPLLHLAFDKQGEATRVGEGFFGGLGLAPQLEQKGIEVKEGYLYAKIELAKKSVLSYLSSLLAKVILSLDFPRKMRWGELTLEYARPLRWITALYGESIIPFTIGDLISGRLTYGHRFMAPAALTLSHPKEYLSLLEKNWVIADAERREKMIVDQLPSEASAREKVLPQVVNLVEYPFLLTASFDPHYLKAPKEVLISEMVEHQKYFPMVDSKGKLLPQFVVVSNNQSSPLIARGHMRALSPRLADGVFLYEEDLKVPLEEFNEQLKKITYQAGLGSLSAKEGRLVKNMELLYRYLPLAPLELCTRAASICKADLASELVKEFPDLQGVIGRIYALHHGEDEAVAAAFEEHWMPLGENAPLPQSSVGILLALADKIDHLLSLFILGEKPSSSSDPYGLRRAALGIIKILLAHKLHLPLKEVLSEAFDLFFISAEIDTSLAVSKEAILTELNAFLLNRVRAYFHELSFEKDEIEAVLVFDLQSVYDLYLRLTALHDFRRKEGFKDLIELQVRCKKILLSQNKNLLPSWRLSRTLHAERFPEVNEKFLKEACERELFFQVQQLKQQFHGKLMDRRDFAHRNYPKAFSELTKLQKPIVALFDEVKVIADDSATRTNRLALLQEVYDLCEELADFSKLSL